MAVFILLCCAGLPARAAAAGPAPVIEPVDCAAFEDSGLSGTDWQCGYLPVPENRQNPQTRTIKVAYAVLRAAGADRQPDPVVYLTGGPGGRAIDSGWDYWKTSPMAKRDVILVDPRGVGYSQPAIDCPQDPGPETGAQPPTAEELLAHRRAWAQSCHDRLVGEGFDLSAYNSLANAADLEDLRQALGYAQWNLYGISYGTRTALYAMRAFPGGIRSAVLDSLLPPQVERFGSFPDTRAGAFSALFAACRADPACDRDYPDLEGQFTKMVQQLDQNPIRITAPTGEGDATRPVWISGEDIQVGLGEAMMLPWLVQITPLVISRLHAGDTEIAERMYPSVLSGDNPGFALAVQCNDGGRLVDPQAFEERIKQPGGHTSQFANALDAAACPQMLASMNGGAGDAETVAVQSDIPALLLNGSDYDPATPPAFARLAAETLPHSIVYVFPGYTHAISNEECPRTMMAGFLHDPTQAPDASCMADMKGIHFVTGVYPNPGAFNIFFRVMNPTSPFSLGIGLIGVVCLAAVFAAPAGFLRSRRAGGGGGLPGLAWAALGLVSALNLIFLGGAWMLAKQSLTKNYGWETLVGFTPPSSRYLFVLPWLSAALAAAVLAFAALAWRRRWWTRAGRIFYSLAAIASAAFIGVLIVLQVL
jgi:pimeloyl-ACP methyl ester carboxylesterase